MPRVKLKQTKGNPTPCKKAAKLETAVVAGKSDGLSIKTKKEKLAKQNEARRKLDWLFVLSTTREDSNSGSEEESEEGSGLDEGRENVSNEDRHRDKCRDRS